MEEGQEKAATASQPMRKEFAAEFSSSIAGKNALLRESSAYSRGHSMPAPKDEPKADPAVALRFRIAISHATDDLLLTRREVAMLLNMSPISVATAVTRGRLIPPIHMGKGPRSIPRWRLGDIRALMNRNPDNAA